VDDRVADLRQELFAGDLGGKIGEADRNAFGLDDV
jgi:hypothetical protein